MIHLINMKLSDLTLNTKKINRYINDVYIDTFQSLKDAAICVGTTNTYAIRDCCKHLRDDYKGAKWYYQSDLEQPDKTKIIA